MAKGRGDSRGGGSHSHSGGASKGGGGKGGGSHTGSGGGKGGGKSSVSATHGGGSKGGGSSSGKAACPQQTQAQKTSAVMRNPTHPTYWTTRGYVPPESYRVVAAQHLPAKISKKS